jgi:hypothetical protein
VMKTKEQRLDDYWSELIMLGNNERFEYVIKNLEKFDDDCKLEVFRETYLMADYGFSNLSEKKIKQIYKGYVSDLPKDIANKEVVKIYRGGTEWSTFYKNAFSWTMDFKIAEFFSTRETKISVARHVVSADIEVKNILDYSNDREEKEILVLPSKLKNIEIVSIKNDNE